MGYRSIPNLYRPEAQDILNFKEVYALEKIHGTSAHIGWDMERKHSLFFFAGGEAYERFMGLFDQEVLRAKFAEMGLQKAVVFGEAYGGKQQGMRETYGPDLRFVAFDVKVGELWLSVPDAEQIVVGLGLQFVAYWKIQTDLATIDAARDSDSPQAVRNGISEPKKMEGIVLRPLIELRKNNGERIVAKHKRDDFRETKSVRQVNAEQVAALGGARAIAEEYVTEMRLSHVLDKMPGVQIQDTKAVILAMVEDVTREAAGEFAWTTEVRKMIAGRAAGMFKRRLMAVHTK